MPHDLKTLFKLFFRKGLLILISLFSFWGPQAEASSEKLAAHPEWLNLLHYKKSFFGGYVSYVRSSEFFLSEGGRSNPEAEVKAHIQAFSQAIASNPDQHPICRFPARFKWLNKQLGWKKEDQLAKCPKYRKWSFEGRVKSVSMMFATGYLGNPASYFGHPLLKFNTGSESSKLLDVSLNFGALTPENENPFVYVAKGLFGGYPAAFSHLQFFFHSHNYSEAELRDIWEYELNLTPDEVHFIVDHSWEMLAMKISYYFLWDNCAFRMAELVEMATGTAVMNPYVPYAIPVSFFDGINYKKKPNGESLVRKFSRIPSRQTKMAAMFKSLPEEDQILTKAIIKDTSTLSKAEFTGLHSEKKSAILETLFDYYSFRIAGDKEDQSFKEHKRIVVLERLKLPPAKPIEPKMDENIPPPHEAPGNFMLRAEHYSGENRRSFDEIVIRPGLYDFLSLEVARPPNSELRVFDTVVRIEDRKAHLRKVDIFSVGTLNASQVDLPGVSGMAWKVRLGVFSQNLSCENCLVAGAEGGLGYAFEISSWLSVYALVSVQVQTEKNAYGTSAVTPIFGGFFDLHRSWKAHFLTATQQFQDAGRPHHQIFEFENRFGSSRYWDIRLSVLENEGRFGRFSFSYYF